MQEDIETRDSYRALLIIEKYRRFRNYVYPMTVNWSNKHRSFKEEFLKTMFEQVKLFNDAGMTNQVSRLYLADAGLSSLREFLQFAAEPSVRLMTPQQCVVAQGHLSESGKILGAWIGKFKKPKQQKRGEKI